ncbi:MAG: hypothetical protein NTZ87_02710 [Candidatus Nomurabacteria bacterium]|nr:hypothetical protein [Candidatus Nomurabacteria bacterium]
MNKTLLITIGAIALIIIAIIIYMDFFAKEYEIASVKTYTSPDGSFSFEYPEFKGWTSGATANKDPWSVWFLVPFETVVAPSIHVSVNLQPSPIALPDILPKNPAGITYTKYQNDGWLSFIIPVTGIAQVSAKVVEMKIPINEDHGFSSQKMAEMIIDTFKFKSNNIVTIKGIGVDSKAGLLIQEIAPMTQGKLIADLTIDEAKKYIGKLIEVKGILHENTCTKANELSPNSISQCFDGEYITNSTIKIIPVTRTIKSFKDLKIGMTPEEVVKSVGEADGDICSGLFCPEYLLKDGSYITLGFSLGKLSSMSNGDKNLLIK